ncbi:fimbrial protein [Serratia proteamaculans]|uniref:Fimbrial protein n=1 Tax=Serratia proteamaculans TaxID=28151 RepID=A0A5Q2VIL9_SERPR|nr:fimbrial protein [Serratia proteamaculans]QGH63263.1 fimbrial protein [Serratia proteamaculans]
MKKTLLATSLAVTAFLSASSAFAADGIVNFTGSITDTACKVDMGASSTLAVPMGKISTTSFSGAGSTAAASKFSLQLKSCPAATTATVKFDGIAANGDDKVLALTAGTGIATGVGVQITDKDGNAVPLQGNSGSYDLKAGDANDPLKDVTNNLDFTARYIATAATVTAGTANATANFTINYN